MLLRTFWNNQERPLYIAAFLYISYYILCFKGAASALKSLGRDTIPVRARSAAPQRWENEVFSHLCFLPVLAFSAQFIV